MHTTENFDSEFLTWGQLKEYLNKIEDDKILNLPVIAQEHHHFTYKKFNPHIELRMELEGVEGSDEYKRRLSEMVVPEFDDKAEEVIHNIETNGPHEKTEWHIDHEKQFNLSLMD